MKRLWISGCAGLAFLFSGAIFPAFSDEAGAPKKAAASAKAAKTAPDEGGPPKKASAAAATAAATAPDEGGPPKRVVMADEIRPPKAAVVRSEKAVYSEDNAAAKTASKSAAKKKSSKSAKKKKDTVDAP
jgi:hypothetical protein